MSELETIISQVTAPPGWLNKWSKHALWLKPTFLILHGSSEISDGKTNDALLSRTTAALLYQCWINADFTAVSPTPAADDRREGAVPQSTSNKSINNVLSIRRLMLSGNNSGKNLYYSRLCVFINGSMIRKTKQNLFENKVCKKKLICSWMFTALEENIERFKLWQTTSYLLIQCHHVADWIFRPFNLICICL